VGKHRGWFLTPFGGCDGPKREKYWYFGHFKKVVFGKNLSL
jgi:hypothetical protein